MNIRFKTEMTYQTLVRILNGTIPYDDAYEKYVLAFFEECSPKLIKAFLQEQGLEYSCIEKLYFHVKDCDEVRYGKEKWKNEY